MSDARDVDALVHQLRTAARAADRLAAHLADLHSLAFEKHVAGVERTSGAAWPPPGVDDVGDPKARALWRRLDAGQHHLVEVVAISQDTLNYLSAGPGAAWTRGSLMDRADLARQLKQQRARAGRGEHVPVRLVDQPGYPGGKAS